MRIIEYHAHRYLPQPARVAAFPWLAVLLALAGLALVLVGLFQTATVYEDGSATIAGWAVCLPGGICNE